MTFTKGLIASFSCLALSASLFAMSRSEEDRQGNRHDHGQYRPAAYQHGDHDRDDHRRAGWDKGKKKGWEGHGVPPGQVKKHHASDRRAHHHRRDWDRRRDERAHHPVVRKPIPMTTKPATQSDRNRAFGQNVQARKAEVAQQRATEKH